MRTKLARCVVVAILATGCGDAGGMGPDRNADGGADGDPDRDAAAEADGGEQADPPVELPPGSREVDGIVNLVDAEIAEAFEGHFQAAGTQPGPAAEALRAALNLFLEFYPEEYDFVFVFPDHEVMDARFAGRFVTINQRAERGGGLDVEYRALGVRTEGRMKGAMAVQLQPGAYGPLAHEIGHYWANHLDPAFGFGAGLNMNYGPHWGFSSVAGELGGFDGSTLECAEPVGALPPDCTALENGRFRYRVEYFFEAGSSRHAYAPLELYLMGLMPGSEVQSTFEVLDDAVKVEDSFDRATNTVLVEASAVREVAFADIVARHGEITLRETDDRHFKSAFVVISSTPATEAALEDVARRARAFGGLEDVSDMPSFAAFTGHRATMDTQLGRRRRATELVPALSEKLTCSQVAQDCPREELGCYQYGEPLCALSGGVQQGQPCDALFECAPGLDCAPDGSGAYVCEPYCDMNSATSDKSCQKLCPGSYILLGNYAGAPSALCVP